MSTPSTRGASTGTGPPTRPSRDRVGRARVRAAQAVRTGRDTVRTVSRTSHRFAARITGHVTAHVTGQITGRFDAATPRHELATQLRENPIVVPTRAQVRARLRNYFDTAEQLDRATAVLRLPAGDPMACDPELIARYERDVLFPIQEEMADVIEELMADLAVGGPPPLRWTWQRWTRRGRRVRWYLRGHRARRGRRAASYGKDEPPF